MTELLEGEFKTDPRSPYVGTEREWAANAITDVANHCSWGAYPQHISPFDLGRALGRALTNCQENDGDENENYKELMRGLHHYYSRKNS